MPSPFPLIMSKKAFDATSQNEETKGTHSSSVSEQKKRGGPSILRIRIPHSVRAGYFLKERGNPLPVHVEIMKKERRERDGKDAQIAKFYSVRESTRRRRPAGCKCDMRGRIELVEPAPRDRWKKDPLPFSSRYSLKSSFLHISVVVVLSLLSEIASI